MLQCFSFQITVLFAHRLSSLWRGSTRVEARPTRCECSGYLLADHITTPTSRIPLRRRRRHRCLRRHQTQATPRQVLVTLVHPHHILTIMTSSESCQPMCCRCPLRVATTVATARQTSVSLECGHLTLRKDHCFRCDGARDGAVMSRLGSVSADNVADS